MRRYINQESINQLSQLVLSCRWLVFWINDNACSQRSAIVCQGRHVLDACINNDHRS